MDKAYINMSEEELRNVVIQEGCYSEEGHTSNDYIWKYFQQFSLEEFLKLHAMTVQDTKESWIEWLEEERLGRLEDRGNEYDSITEIEEYWVPNPEVEPVIMVLLKNNTLKIWDGNHRVGIAFKNDMTNIPVILGKER